ncbi:hypothetical protein QOZ80_5BG0422070 [Eleusine coracana subsp. coracana]|nr:hypothetical protein QOZ80_5BG0422070 [Eleusine coracana subsp. coracana]
MTGVAAMTTALCRCGHCGAVRRLRMEGDFASCGVCGKVLLQLRGDKERSRALSRRRRQMKKRGKGEEGRAAGRGDMGGDVGVKRRRGAVSDAESTVTTG